MFTMSIQCGHVCVKLPCSQSFVPNIRTRATVVGKNSKTSKQPKWYFLDYMDKHIFDQRFDLN